jgi:hypothetical protein
MNALILRRRHLISPRLTWTAALLAAALAAAPPVRGYSDNFNDGTDAGWSHYDPLGQAGYANPATYTFPSGDSYEITAGVSFAPSAAGPSRAGSYRADQTYTDFVESVDIVGWSTGTAGLNESIGLLARISNPGLGTTDAYSLTYSTGGHDLVLDRITGEQPLGNPLARMTIGPPYLPEGGVYRLVFTGNGNTLTGSLYNDGDPSSPVLLDTLTATDSAYSSGYAGLILFDNTDSGSGSNGADATFDNFTAVPEPGLMGLLIGAMALSFARPRH